MIPSLHISGFKVFRDIKLPRLGSLNLFVGKNNTGKTCLLEAVELYASSSPWEILEIAFRREPDAAKNRRSELFDPYELDTFLQPLLSVFHRDHGHIHKPTIRLSAGNPKAELELPCDPMLAEVLENEAMILNVDKNESSPRKRRLRHVLEDGITLARGSKRQQPLFLELAMRRHSISEDAREVEGWRNPDAALVAFLPARGFTNSEAKRLWDNAQLAGKDELLVQWLRLIEPEARNLSYIGDSGSGVGVPYLKINGDRGRSPLGSMGDGLTRLFHIGLAMVNASGGILLIDEFENGLHWEVQEQLWKALFEAANQFGVQVFATTHSNDCIRAFMDAQNSRLIPSESFVYRLERSGDDVYALELPSENLNAALRQQVEVR